ncbi:hypothetical protein pipiens_017086, partial [Culex pipiens pipiens]
MVTGMVNQQELCLGNGSAGGEPAVVKQTEEPDEIEEDFDEEGER